MDAAHFDAIAKKLATTGSRRRALGGLLALVAAALLPRSLTSAKRKHDKHHQDHKRKGQHTRGKRDNDQHGVKASGKGKNNKKKKKGNKKNNKTNTPTTAPAEPAPTPPSLPPPTGCAAGLTDCGGQCVNLSNDARNCGLCGFSCAQFSPNTQCVNGSCPCDPGTAFCPDPSAPSGGACTPLGTHEHCQRCGDTCSASACEVATCDPATGCQRQQKPDGVSCGPSQFCHAEACVDYGFLTTLKLPWCGGDREPRTLVQDWNPHDGRTDFPAVGFALDFGLSASGDPVLSTPVLAPMAGTLKRDPYGPNSGYGNHVRIDADNGWQVILAHLEQPSPVANNIPVQHGDLIGKLGNTGISEAPHIHIEIRYDNNKPKALFANDAGELPLYGYKRDDFTFGNGKTFTSTQRQCAADPCAGVDCSGLSDGCNDGVCDASGQCVAEPKPDGTGCGESGQVCVSGACQQPESYVFVTKWGQEGSGDGEFSHPTGVAVDSNGLVYVAENTGSRVQVFSDNGASGRTLGTAGSADGQFHNPWMMGVDQDRNVYVADTANNRIQKFRSDGTHVDSWGSFGTGDEQFIEPTGVAVDSNGFVYVADRGNARIQKLSNGGAFEFAWGSFGTANGQFRDPTDIAVDEAGNVYVADTGNSRIQKFDDGGMFRDKWGSFGTDDGQFMVPRGVAVDRVGFVYVSDVSRQCIQKFRSDGTLLASWGTLGTGDGQFTQPHGVAVSATGQVYVADTGNHRIQVFAPSAGGTITAERVGTQDRGADKQKEGKQVGGKGVEKSGAQDKSRNQRDRKEHTRNRHSSRGHGKTHRRRPHHRHSQR